MNDRDRWTVPALWAGVAVPFLYYGLQAAAAPFFPGFRFLETTASELGSDLAEYAAAFNAGILTLGAITLVAALGIGVRLRRTGSSLLLAGLSAGCVGVNGLQTLWAGCYPMPDPRHGGHPVFLVGMLALPVVLTVALWPRVGSTGRGFFVSCLVVLVAMVPVMSGPAGLDTHAYRGLLQRVFTLTIFPPIAVTAWVLLFPRPRREQ